jgi:predicted Zn-dependent peptidase
VSALDVREWTLPNGLRALFLADHRAPVATVQVFYHVGSKDEHVGIRGVAHMFEHMMFKGSARVPPEEHARLLRRIGGDANAFTTEDLTAYHETVPPADVGFALELEAERMRHLRLTPETVASERKVVEEEKRLTIDNNPIGQVLERFRALAFTTHPYRWTALGTLEDLEKVTPADCQAFYDRYYQPNNATVVVVGDLEESKVRDEVARAFGGTPAGKPLVREAAAEPPQSGLRRDVLRTEVQVPVVVGGYHVPAARAPETAALEVLAAILAQGESARFPARLVRRDRVVVEAGALDEALEASSLFVFYGAFLPDRDPQDVEAALRREIGEVRDRGVTEGEVSRAKNQLLVDHLQGLRGVEGIATALGTATYVEGSWRALGEAIERISKVTPEDVARVARAYLRDEGLSILHLLPRSREGGAE